MRLAGIDIGTNTVRLLIADFDWDGQFKEVCTDREITRLGEGIVHTGALAPETMERTLKVLRRYRELCDTHRVEEVSAVATSAVREASNGADFVGRIGRELSFPVRVLSGDEEAAVTLLGVTRDLPPSLREASSLLVMDIGGGSTEFVLYAPASRPDPSPRPSPRKRGEEVEWNPSGEILYRISTDLGVVRMTEGYLTNDPVTPSEWEALTVAVDRELARVKPPSESSPALLVGTAGTVTTLAAIQLGLSAYDPRQVHLSVLKKPVIEKQLARLSRMTAVQRREIPGLESGREDIILAGTLIVDRVMDRFGFEELVVSDNGLREGVVLALYQELRGNHE